jgi:hypothetical protein
MKVAEGTVTGSFVYDTECPCTVTNIGSFVYDTDSERPGELNGMQSFSSRLRLKLEQG